MDWEKEVALERKWLPIQAQVESVIKELGMTTTVRLYISDRTYYHPTKNYIHVGINQHPYAIYCEYKGKLVKWKRPFGDNTGTHKSLGYAIACVMLEEIAHAYNWFEGGKDAHQAGFMRHFIRVWNRFSDEMIKVCEEVFKNEIRTP